MKRGQIFKQPARRLSRCQLAIIGGGPAGLGAGIQACHYGLDTVLIEKRRLGGRLAWAGLVENFPLTGRGMAGAVLARKLSAQARCKGLRTVRKECTEINFSRKGFQIRTDGGTIKARAVIVATGTEPRKLSLPGLATAGRRVVYSWKEVAPPAGKTVLVAGGGEIAFDQACSLARKGAKVTVLVRGRRARAFAGLVRRARRTGVKILYNNSISNIGPCGAGLVCSVTNDGKQTRMTADRLLVAIGSRPTIPAVTMAALQQRGRGLYFAGDVDGGESRQAAIAYGDGVRCAMMACQQIKEGGR